MLLRHLGFIHGPIREHCPVFPNCMDVLIEKFNALRARRYPFVIIKKLYFNRIFSL
jgi:hypothetical protein